MLKYEHFKNLVFYYEKTHQYEHLMDLLKNLKSTRLNINDLNKLITFLNKSLTYNNNLVNKIQPHINKIKELLEYLEYYKNEIKIAFLNSYINVIYD